MDWGDAAGWTALAAHFFRGVRGWWVRPRLTPISFDATRDLGVWNVTFANPPAVTRKCLTRRFENDGSTFVTGCLATLTVLTTPGGHTMLETKFVLHWADTPDGPSFNSGTPVDIGSEHRRLDIAYTQQGIALPGCWLMTAFAIPNPGQHQAYLPPGRYECELVVRSRNAADVRLRLDIHSPQTWDQLAVEWK